MITMEQTREIAGKIAQLGINESVLATLRQTYPGIHFTYCMDDDIPNNEPVLTHDDFNLYLVDGREHCLCLTNNPEVATGIVVAEIIPD
ncbi:DUF6129 family protein [Methylobacter sp. YRD-M1]|uniref:DUF6129 family protein n=1 Tax=Methylobacter sp. YRD-M1 TaxID=2911520 RepID=UPI00227C58E9|nr:DUF6129 family protein [Methylobacter sp. YRD-M1]WAK03098.1 DUF6129 family protein [Methylobacter sp. YRD-M1]